MGDASTKKRSLKIDDGKGTVSIGTASGNFRVDREEEKEPLPKHFAITLRQWKRERETRHTQKE